MAHLDRQHDRNEKARREAETIAQKIADPDGQKVALEVIAEFYDLIRKRIERGIYKPGRRKSPPTAA